MRRPVTTPPVPTRRVYDEASPGPPCRDCGGKVPAKLATDLHPTCGKEARELIAASRLARGLRQARSKVATTTTQDQKDRARGPAPVTPGRNYR